MKNRSIQWLWLVPLLLLMAGIVAPRLAWDGLWYDEIFSIMNSRGAHYGPVTLEAIWSQVSQNDPHQAFGYPYLLAFWGLAVGWTEFALRTFSLLCAGLAVAVTYQLGKRLVSPQAGLYAASILAISSYFINYTHELRSFTFVALFAASLLLSYHALLHSRKPPALKWQLLFVVSGTALLWSHYYTAMLLLALALYHLLFVKKDKIWLQIVGLAFIVLLLFLPEVPSVIKGYTVYSPDDLEIAPLSAWGVITAVVYFIGNNFALLAITALVSALIHAWREAYQLRMPILVCLFASIILLISNEILGILEPTRLRYLIFLWPLLAVCLGAGLAYLGKQLQQFFLPYLPTSYHPFVSKSLVLLLPLLWLINGVQANYQADFNATIAGDVVPRLRLMSNELGETASSSDFLVFYNGTNREAYYMQLVMEYNLTGLAPKWAFSSSVFHETEESTRSWARGQIAEAQRIWYGVNRTLPLNETHEAFLALLAEDFIYCGNHINEADLSLDLYARSQSFCPTNAQITQFGSEFILKAYEQSVTAGQLHLKLAWELGAGIPADAYSLGVYIMPHGVTDLLSQTDRGFPLERHVLMDIELALSDLPAGEYDLWLAVYNWQTAERLLLPGGDNLWLLTSFEVE
jgi:hypothetical protein